MPDGSSSAAPVISPGPRFAKNPRAAGFCFSSAMRYARLQSNGLKDSLLLLESSECADIRHGEGDPELVIESRNDIEPLPLDTQAATVGVVRDLRGRILHRPGAEVIGRCERGVPSPVVRIPEP